jgi:hypothetical protein
LTDKTISHFAFRISELPIHLNKHLRNKIHRVSQNKSLSLKLKKGYIIRNIGPSNRDDVERVQHFMKWQAMALPPAQDLTTLISARQQNEMGSFYDATKSKSQVRASSLLPTLSCCY